MSAIRDQGLRGRPAGARGGVWRAADPPARVAPAPSGAPRLVPAAAHRTSLSWLVRPGGTLAPANRSSQTILLAYGEVVDVFVKVWTGLAARGEKTGRKIIRRPPQPLAPLLNSRRALVTTVRSSCPWLPSVWRRCREPVDPRARAAVPPVPNQVSSMRAAPCGRASGLRTRNPHPEIG